MTYNDLRKQMGVDEIIAEKEIGLVNIISSSPSVASTARQSEDLKQTLWPQSQNQEKNLDLHIVNAPNDNSPLQTRMLADSCNDLETLRKAVCAYKDLEIAKIANKVVFADGVPSSKIMLIGEAPGANEDLQGIPFCGQSGQLLDAALETIGLSRKNNLYITNSVFWRPPANRRPTNNEIAACLPFVEKHIKLIDPNLIILAGATAVHSVLGVDEPITKIKAQKHFYTNQYLHRKIPVVILYHPSYLLRQSSQKKTMWFDLLRIKRDFLQL